MLFRACNEDRPLHPRLWAAGRTGGAGFGAKEPGKGVRGVETATIRILDQGPIMVSGPVQILDGEGKPYKADGAVYLCRCGHSSHKPFCDGAHKGRLDHCFRAEAVL